LNKLFIEPRHIRSGVGRALLAHAIVEARRRGAGRLTILADPNAAAWLRSRQLPGETARQLPDLSTIIRVEPSHTDDSRLQGALPTADVPILKLHEKSELVGCAP
jgi:GNAT superfamily N-acetyltransferase